MKKLKKTNCSKISLIILLGLMTFTSCKEIEELKESEETKETSFKNYEIVNLKNADYEIKDGKLYVNKTDLNKKEFGFTLKPENETKYVNVYFDDMYLDKNTELVTEIYTKDLKSGSLRLASSKTFSDRGISLKSNDFKVASEMDLKAFSAKGGWGRPDHDIVIDSVAPIWPFIIAGILYAADHYCYSSTTDYDADGNVTGSHTTHDWGTNGGGNGGDPWGDGKEMLHYELNTINREKNNDIIESTTISCTGKEKIVIKDILTGRGPL